MADEVRNANVVVLSRSDEGIWRARIGPSKLGVSVEAGDPCAALLRLALQLQMGGWQFDPSYKPKATPTFHDA